MLMLRFAKRVGGFEEMCDTSMIYGTFRTVLLCSPDSSHWQLRRWKSDALSVLKQMQAGFSSLSADLGQGFPTGRGCQVRTTELFTVPAQQVDVSSAQDMGF